MAVLGGARPRLRALLLAQFVEGFGARFHGVLLGLLALRLGGLDGFAGFVAASMLGTGLAAVAAGWLATRTGGDTIIRIAAASLMVARVVSYLLIPFGVPLAGLIALRLVGSVAGSLLNTGVKVQVPEGPRASASLAWMNVSNGGGQAAAAVVAAALSTAAPLAVAGVGGPIAIAATVPALRLARFAGSRPVPLRDQLAAIRSASPPIVVGACVFVVLNALPSLADGLTVELYSPAWLGPLALVAFAGSFMAAGAVRRLAGTLRRLGNDAVAWAGVGVVGVVGWAAADRGIVWLIVARFTAGAVGPLLAALVEARVLDRVGRERGLPALSASGAIASFVGAGSATVLPSVVEVLGFGGTVALSCVGLGLLAATASVTARAFAVRRTARAGVSPA